MSGHPEFEVTVHLEGGRTMRQALYTMKAARHYAKQACGRPDVELITLDSPVLSCELWSRKDLAPPVATPIVATAPEIAFRGDRSQVRRFA